MSKNVCMLFRAARRNSWYLPFTWTSPWNRDIEEKIILTEKRKWSHSLQTPRRYGWHLHFTCVTSKNQNMEEKNFGTKNENVRILFRHRVGTAVTSLSLVRLPKIEISKKIFGPKNENASIQFRLPLWYRWHLSFTSAISRNGDIERKNFRLKNENSRILFMAPC